jgi:WD40 repeat protein
MKNQLLFVPLFLLVAQIGWAQCNPKEYKRIFSEAVALQEKGEFIEAKNRYEAAKIYACGQGEKDAADDKIDALFEQIDQLRYRADSTAEANRRQTLSAYANDLAYKSTIALRDDNRTVAFRLAEFAWRYLDPGNLKVGAALTRAAYLHESKKVSGLLPWCERALYHRWAILCLAFSPDGRYLATGDGDDDVRIWDLSTGQVVLTLKGHDDEVNTLAFSPDGYLLVSASADSTVLVWNLSDGEHVRLGKHSASVLSVAFSPDGQLVASGSSDSTVIIWNVLSKQKEQLLKAQSKVFTLGFSPDGRYLAIGERDGSIQIRNLSDSKDTLKIEGEAAVFSAAFSPDGKWLVAGLGDGSINLWEFPKGTLKLTWKAHQKSVQSVSFSPGSNFLASGSNDGSVKLWEVPKGRELLVSFEKELGIVYGVAFSPDGRRLTAGFQRNFAKLWDITGDTSFIPTLSDQTSHFLSATFSPSGKLLAIGSQNGATTIWDLETGSTHAVNQHQEPAVDISFARDGLSLTTLALDGACKTWYLDSKDTFSQKSVIGNIMKFNFKSAKENIETSGALKLAGQDTDSRIGPILKNISDGISSLALSPDGKWLAVGSMSLDLEKDDIVSIWDIAHVRKEQTFQTGKGTAMTLSFSPDGKLLAVGSIGGIIVIQDLVKKSPFQTFDSGGGTAWSVAFSPDGQRLAVGSWTGKVGIWDCGEGKEWIALENAHDSWVRSVSFSPDGRRLATASWDGTVKVWDFPEKMVPEFTKKYCIAALSKIQLEAFDLEKMLYQSPENLQILLETGEINQIRAFAELHADLTEKSGSAYCPDSDLAIKLYEWLLTHADSSQADKNALAVLYGPLSSKFLLEGKVEAAKEAARKSVHLIPEDELARQRLGHAQLFSGNEQQALATYAVALDLAGPLKENLAVYIYKRLGEYQKKGLKEEPVLKAQAFLLGYIEDPELAFQLKAYQRAYELAGQQLAKAVAEPVDSMALGSMYGNFSWYALFAQKPADAIEAASKATNLNGKNWPKTNLAHAYLLTGNWEMAQRIYTELKPLPDDSREDEQMMAPTIYQDLKKLADAGLGGPLLIQAAGLVLDRLLNEEEKLLLSARDN